MQRKSLSDRIFSALLRILPFDFRSEYGTEMELTFQDHRAEMQEEGGAVALARMWWNTISDIFLMAPREHLTVLSQDLRYALRMMKKNFGFTLSAVLILALGIGANSAIFSVLNSVLLKPLPYAEGDGLVVIRHPQVKLGVGDSLFSVPELRDLRERTKSLTDLVEYHTMTFTLLGGSEARSVRTGVVSPQYFHLFGVKPLLGRTFVAADDAPGAEAVLVLSYEFWKQAEGGDPHIVGRHYRMNDRTHTVIGVLPPIPQYPYENDIYMPTSSCPFRSRQTTIDNRQTRLVNLFGRLKQNVTQAQCANDLAGVSTHLAADYPDAYPKTSGFTVIPTLLRGDLTKQARPMIYVLLSAAGFVLLIACANVANLVLSRMARRKQELMIRAAMGAGSGRLLRQLLTESFLLAIAASVLGLLLASGSLELLKEFIAEVTPRAREIAMDHRVLAFAMLCAGAVTVFCGSISALSSRHDLASGMKEGGYSGTERGGNLIRRVLIVAQVAFSFVLLIGAGLMINSFARLLRVYPGFESENIIAARIDLNNFKYTDTNTAVNFGRRVLEQLQSQPGVVSAAIGSSFPLDPVNLLFTGQPPARFQVEGDFRPDSELPPVSFARSVTVDYFKTLGIPVVSGRAFRESDDSRAASVMLVNQALAVKRWGKRDPVGSRITFDNGATWSNVVGVVGNVKESGLNGEIPYQIYQPIEQTGNVGSIIVRTTGDPQMMEELVRKAVNQADPEVPISFSKTLEEVRTDSVSSQRTLMRLFAMFGVLALLIAVGGISSMLALWVRQRMREIGIRMALGASPRVILRNVMRQGMILVAAGLALGLMLALGLSGFIATLLYQVHPYDQMTYLLVCVILMLAAAVACYPSARRASAVDPLLALRWE